MRHSAGIALPEEALPHCLAAVVTASRAGDKIPAHDEALSAWLVHEVHQNPEVVKSVLGEMWIIVATKNQGALPGFNKLRKDSGSLQFLTSLSADVLKAGINDNPDKVRELVSFLLHHDHQAALAVGETELVRHELSYEVRAIWTTALFVIDPSKYSEPWGSLMSGQDAALWEAIEVIMGERHEKGNSVSLTPAQRAEVIRSLGARFTDIRFPSGELEGSRTPWDASKFVGNQIRLLAADASTDAGVLLEHLENEGGLASYRDLIRHHRAEYEKRQRESSFTFASPEQVARAIRNGAPATPNDL